MWVVVGVGLLFCLGEYGGEVSCLELGLCGQRGRGTLCWPRERR